MTTTTRLGLAIITSDDPVDIQPIAENFQLIDDQVGLKIKTIPLTLTSSQWNDKHYTITNLTNITATTIGFLNIDYSSTVDINERNAIINAKIFISSQSDEQIILTADGIIPNVDIHLILILLGDHD